MHQLLTHKTHSGAEANTAVQTWQPSSVEGNNRGILKSAPILGSPIVLEHQTCNVVLVDVVVEVFFFLLQGF